MNMWDFPGSPVVKTAIPLQGIRVWSLVGELRSHMPRGLAKKQKKTHHHQQKKNTQNKTKTNKPPPKTKTKKMNMNKIICLYLVLFSMCLALFYVIISYASYISKKRLARQ